MNFCKHKKGKFLSSNPFCELGKLHQAPSENSLDLTFLNKNI
jgi:hypothetical protein